MKRLLKKAGYPTHSVASFSIRLRDHDAKLTQGRVLMERRMWFRVAPLPDLAIAPVSGHSTIGLLGPPT